MSMTKQKSITQIALYLGVILLPLLVLVWGIARLLRGWLPSATLIIAYGALPLLTIVVLTGIVFWSKRKLLRFVLPPVVLLIAFQIFFVLHLFGSTERLIYARDGEIGEEYSQVCDQFPSMPALDEVGVYTLAEHYNYHLEVSIFQSEADTLILHYDEEEYEAQKALLDIRYLFQKTDAEASDETCAPTVRIGDTRFRLLAVTGEYGSEFDFPKRMIWIATNDKEHTIAYTVYVDSDLDVVPSPENFLLNDCGWKHLLP